MANYVPIGIATAYAYAKSKGYTGTEEEFAEYLANASTKAQQTVAKAEEASQSANDAAASAVMADEITFGSEDPDSPYKDDNALKYKQEAEEAKNKAEATLTHPNKIVDGIWYIWDAENEEYTSAEVPASGVEVVKLS